MIFVALFFFFFLGGEVKGGRKAPPAGGRNTPRDIPPPGLGVRATSAEIDRAGSSGLTWITPPLI